MVENQISNEPESYNTSFDWTLDPQNAFDFNSFLSPASLGANRDDLVQQTNHDHLVSAQPSSTYRPSKCVCIASSHVTNDPIAASQRKLTKILLDADELWTRFPLRTTLHVPQAESQNGLLDQIKEATATNISLEIFFDLAQQLIDVYPAALDASFAANTQSLPDCDIADCTHTLDLPTSLSKLEEQVVEQTRSAAPEMALMDLLVSCHIRLLDILDRCFLMIAACTRVTLANRQQPDIELSETRVGSFELHGTAAALMHIALLGHLVSRLESRVCMMGVSITTFTETCDGDSDELIVLQSQHKLLTNKQKKKSEQMSIVEDFLRRFDLGK